MQKSESTNRIELYARGEEIGASRWIEVDQNMISAFGHLTLDPDPMHMDAAYAERNGPFGGTIAFGFLTLALLTHMLHDAMGGADYHGRTAGHYLNYGFDRLRFVAPVKVGSKIRGVFRMADLEMDEKARWQATFDCTIEIEGESKPALVANWLAIWVPGDAE